MLKATQNNSHKFHSEPPYSQGSGVWGYDGFYPGPTFVSRYGEPILMRIINELFFDENGNRRAPSLSLPGNFGKPQRSYGTVL